MVMGAVGEPELSEPSGLRKVKLSLFLSFHARKEATLQNMRMLGKMRGLGRGPSDGLVAVSPKRGDFCCVRFGGDGGEGLSDVSRVCEGRLVAVWCV